MTDIVRASADGRSVIPVSGRSHAAPPAERTAAALERIATALERPRVEPVVLVVASDIDPDSAKIVAETVREAFDEARARALAGEEPV
jgi:hypothetical protein